MSIRKICAIIVDRANYGRMWPVLKELKKSEKVNLSIICSGTMVLERFGNAINNVRNDGFTVDDSSYIEIEGSTTESMSRTIGLGIIEFSASIRKIDPDIVLIIGDRYEALAACIAAAYNNYCIAHIQGGEVSGSIDECARHAITKFSHIHFPSTLRSKEFLIKMGEQEGSVHFVGCPSGDYIKRLENKIDLQLLHNIGVGSVFDLDNPFLLVIYHPDTRYYTSEGENVKKILSVLNRVKLPTIWLWPNIDAGSDSISKEIRKFREKNLDNHWLHLIKNLPPKLFQQLLKITICAVGNSSSFIRDSTFSGTPVVIIGDRQENRECGINVIKVDYNETEIEKAIKTQISIKRYKPDKIYGTGNASKKIRNILETTSISNYKKLNYLTYEGTKAR